MIHQINTVNEFPDFNNIKDKDARAHWNKNFQFVKEIDKRFSMALLRVNGQIEMANKLNVEAAKLLKAQKGKEAEEAYNRRDQIMEPITAAFEAFQESFKRDPYNNWMPFSAFIETVLYI